MHDSIVACSVDTLYNILFVDIAFFEEICRVKNTSNLDVCEWTGNEGVRTRELGYTVALNIRIGPKSARASEKQEEMTVNKRNMYVIKSDVATPDVPYGGSFFGRAIYIVARETSTTAHLSSRKRCCRC